ncbi:hypothetical protein ES332_A02G107900v1 [Gossypium tomentosum]|uniref:Uncharacterized protein n=1 Tax=Gossypium tomentosum TaxID=34277 RepID=A0A5D2RIL9_GOSTO|nr:hypothetical protein ES332_A02G107900v1 [Gossypium tomentosum]
MKGAICARFLPSNFTTAIVAIPFTNSCFILSENFIVGIPFTVVFMISHSWEFNSTSSVEAGKVSPNILPFQDGTGVGIRCTTISQLVSVLTSLDRIFLVFRFSFEIRSPSSPTKFFDIVCKKIKQNNIRLSNT